MTTLKTIVSVKLTFNCSLERAFKTPILGDATQFLVGYGIIPAVVKFTKDDTWGKVGGQRVPHGAKNLLSKGGEIGLDEIYNRDENVYWKWGISNFYQWSMGFTEFQGELFFIETKKKTIKVHWKYTLFSKSKLAYPLHWLFGNIFWKKQMKIGIQKMKDYAESNAKFLYK